MARGRRGPSRQRLGRMHAPPLPTPAPRPPAGRAGYGITAVLEGGRLLEKAAANISVVKGTLSAARAQSMSSRGRSSIDPAGGQPYAAAAMSLVFHSAHAMVPTLRADVRLFQVGGLGGVVAGCLRGGC
jgi:coproporphyrinogen III oxidase